MWVILAGTTGHIKHGKNALIDGFLIAEPRSQATESSFLISKVADQLNDALVPLQTEPLYDAFDVLKRWLDGALPRALHLMTPLAYNAGQLVLNKQHILDKPDSYRKLFSYLDSVDANPTMLERDITSANKDKYRPLLQWLGGYVTERLGESLWYREIVRRAMAAQEAGGCKFFGCSGIRFPVDEVEWRKADGFVIDVIRPGFPIADADDPTERLRSQVIKDTTVYNDGTLEQLHATAAIMYADMLKDQLKQEYYATAA